MLPFGSLNRNGDFRRLYHRTPITSHCLVTYAAKNRLPYHRIGITTSKKLGHAYERNRARRVIKESFRLLLPMLPQGRHCYDWVFVARRRTTCCPMQEVFLVMQKHAKSVMGP